MDQNRIPMEELIDKAGGVFPLITMINQRLRQLKGHAKPLVPGAVTNPRKIVLEEIMADKTLVVSNFLHLYGQMVYDQLQLDKHFLFLGMYQVLEIHF